MLESLVQYYEALARKGELPKTGWSEIGVSYALVIDKEGSLVRVISLKQQDDKKMIPRKMSVPTPVKRSSGVSPNYLCDNSSYFLGIDGKGKPERAKECFNAAREIHKKLLPKENDAAIAVNNYFEKWNIEAAEENSVLKDYLQDIIKGGNLIFQYDGEFVQKVDEIGKHWDDYVAQASEETKIRCSMTGKMDSLAVLHPSIKGIKKTQSAGASLVSFNAAAFESYGKEQGANAQTGKYAADAYGEALNSLIRQASYKNYIGDTLVLFYSINGEKAYQNVISSFLLDEDYYSKQDLANLVKDICQGKEVCIDNDRLDLDMEFFLIGLAPNNARISVRFFHRGSFGEFIRNLQGHQERLFISSNKEDEAFHLSIWQMLMETCRSGADPSPVLAGELTRSIIENTRYPATLINAIDLRIRADHKVDRRRAAIIKAYYLKNENKQIPKEVLTVGLNKETNVVPYNLGRLFAVLELIQTAANPGLNATIKDKYFSGVSSTPGVIVPKLIELAQKHLRKLDPGRKVYFNKQLGEILDKFDGTFPKSLSMAERGAFQLGYYHQVQENYKSKKEEE